MKELEEISMEQREGAGLSKDYKLGDAKFVLGSFRNQPYRRCSEESCIF